jgi:hypothetical protein
MEDRRKLESKHKYEKEGHSTRRERQKTAKRGKRRKKGR